MSAASETFIISVSTVSDILIAKSYEELLANTENLKEKNRLMSVVFFDRLQARNTDFKKEQITGTCT